MSIRGDKILNIHIKTVSTLAGFQNMPSREQNIDNLSRFFL
jgi:hypothetical protein